MFRNTQLEEMGFRKEKGVNDCDMYIYYNESGIRGETYISFDRPTKDFEINIIAKEVNPKTFLTIAYDLCEDLIY